MVTYSEFAGVGLVADSRRRAENERQLVAELTSYDVREPWDAMARNDHTDWKWDDRVFASLNHLDQDLKEIEAALGLTLERMDGYSDRFAQAPTRASAGQHKWLDEPGIDSCHTVWFELHEDLLAT